MPIQPPRLPGAPPPRPPGSGGYLTSTMPGAPEEGPEFTPIVTPITPPPGSGPGPAPGPGPSAPPPGAPPPSTPAPGAGPAPAPAPGGGGPLNAQQLHTTNNSNISVAQWQKWIDEGKQNPNGTWKSSKICNGGPCPDSGDHPDACPSGWAAHGINECRPSGGGGGGAGGPGGGGGGEGWIGGFPPGGGPGGGSPYMSWQDDYGLSNYFKSLMGDSQMQQAALGSTMSGIAGDRDALLNQLKSSLPQGGGRDRAIAKLLTDAQGQAATARMELPQRAAASLQDLFGTQLSGSLEGRGQDIQQAIARMQDATNRYGISSGNEIDWARLGETQRQFDTGQGNWGREFERGGDQFERQFAEDTRRYGLDYAQRQREMNEQRKQARANMWGNIAGGLLGFLSDIRTKEHIKPWKKGLDDLRKIEAIEYEYNGKAGSQKGKKAVSVSAQALEKLMPEAVEKVETEDFSDTRVVDLTKLLMTTVNAVKELDARTRNKVKF